MRRHGLAVTALALAGTLLILPDSVFARSGGPGFRAPAFTTVPNRIFLPTFRPRFHAGRPIHGPGRFRAPPSPTGYAVRPQSTPYAATSAYTGMGVRPVTHTVGGRHLFRVKHHRRINGWNYPVTVSPDEEFFGTPYDPSDIPVLAPRMVELPAPGPAVAAPQLPPTVQPRSCRSEQVTVPAASGTGEREITIVRC